MKKLKNSIGSGIFFLSLLGSAFAQQPDTTVPQSQAQTPQAPTGQMAPVPDQPPQPATPVQPVQPALPGELPAQRPVLPPAPAPGIQPPRPFSPVIPQQGLPAQTVPVPGGVQAPSKGESVPTPGGSMAPSGPAAPEQVPSGQTAPSPGEPLSGPQPRGVVQVEFENEKVNVLAENNTFGEVMNAMAQKARFKIKLPPDVSSRRISISLYDVPLERAIIRLFSLVQEKNYQVKYGPNGEVERIEFVSGKKGKQPGERGQQPFPGSGRGLDSPQRRYSPRMMTPQQPQNIPQPQQPGYIPPQAPVMPQPPEEPAGDGENEDTQ